MSIEFSQELDTPIISPTFAPQDAGEIGLRPKLLADYTGQDKAKGNLSVYARGADYHHTSQEIASKLILLLKDAFPKDEFFNFADHSPIAEVSAAARSGLGVIGKNRLFIDSVYGSYVFINCIFTSLSAWDSPKEIKNCIDCGKCEKVCPTGSLSSGDVKSCLSFITQKKGSLSDEEKSLIRESGCIWGCDLCQSVCPMNATAKNTNIKEFLENRIAVLTKEKLLEMSDEEFSKRAFSFRGREVLFRNLELFD